MGIFKKTNLDSEEVQPVQPSSTKAVTENASIKGYKLITNDKCMNYHNSLNTYNRQ